jgi:hypothetical protein
MNRNLYANLAITALAQDGVLKIARYPESPIAWIGAAELLCVALCVVPRTSLAGAALFTAYLTTATVAAVVTWLDFTLGLALLPVIWLGPTPRKQLDRLVGGLDNLQRPPARIKTGSESASSSDLVLMSNSCDPRSRRAA